MRVAVVCKVLWRCRNEVIFRKGKLSVEMIPTKIHLLSQSFIKVRDEGKLNKSINNRVV